MSEEPSAGVVQMDLSGGVVHEEIVADGGQVDAEPHPAARHSDQLAWAVWLEGDRIDDCVAVVADSEAEAKVKATEEYCQRNEDVVAARDIDIYHVDGPIQNGEPAIFEFEFVTEHRETVVVEAPSESYAKESAEAERDYRGELVQTVHTEVREVPKDGE